MNTDKLNILFISHEAELGGAPRSLIGMIDSLRDKINPLVIIPCNGNLERLMNLRRITYHIVPFKNGFAHIGSYNKEEIALTLRNNIIASETIADIAKSNCIDLVHSNTSVSDVGIMAAIKAGLPHLWHLREFCEEDFGYEFLDKEWKKKLFLCSDFFSISKSVQQMYWNKYRIQSEIAIDCMEFSNITPLQEKFNKDYIYLIIAGSISNGKGQMDAIRAIEYLVNKKRHNFRLLIIGHGTPLYLWSINHYISANGLSEYIKILPFSNNMDNIRDRCDISLTCSKMEALGRVTMEAMFAGLTVIGTNTGGTLELIGENQERGYLYEPSNIVQLAETIEYVIRDVNGRNEKRIYAREYVKHQTNPEEYAVNILNAYQKCIDRVKEKKAYRNNILEYMQLGGITNSSSNKMDSNKFREMFFVAEKWIRMKQMGKKFEDFFDKNNIRTIAIYGLGYLGRDLYTELNQSNVCIKYIIDKNAENLDKCFNLIKPGEEMEGIDLILVTVIANYESLCQSLKTQYKFPLMNIDDIITELIQCEEEEWWP